MYADRITLVKVEEGGYNPETHEQDKATIDREILPCHVNYMNEDSLIRLYGKLDIEVITVRFQTPVTMDFDYCEYKGERFEVESRLKLPSEYTLTLRSAGAYDQDNG